MGVLSLGNSVCHVHAWCLGSPENSVRTSGTTDTETCEPIIDTRN